MAVSALAAIIVLSVLAGGTAYAAQGSLPGDLLYPVKTGGEDARLLLTVDSAARVELNLEFARARLQEISRLVNTNQEKTQLAVNGYMGNLASVGQHISSITNPSDRSAMLGLTLVDLRDQVAFCDNVMDANPEYPEPIREAVVVSINQQAELLMLLAQDNILQAAQINLDAMQDRLQRALSRANSQQYQAVQEALLQYQQFSQLGMQIQQRAQSAGNHSIEIENLNSQSLSGWLAILNRISQQAPPEYQGNIEASRQLTLQYKTQAQQKQSNQDDIDSQLEISPPQDESSNPAGGQNDQPSSSPQDKGTGSTGETYSACRSAGETNRKFR